MDRREALKRVALLLGGAVSASVASGVLAGCRADGPEPYAPLTLTPAQDELVATLAELIIPETDTPGARGTRVNVFIDQMLTGGLTDAERDAFLAGLVRADARALDLHGTPFLENTPPEQTAVLTALAADDAPFFRQLKELTLVGYYTSEIGATQELRYVHVAGRYDGDVPFSEIGRAYA